MRNWRGKEILIVKCEAIVCGSLEKDSVDTVFKKKFPNARKSSI